MRQPEEQDLICAPSVVAYFSTLPDHRVERTRRYELVDVLVIALCAVLCGAETFVEMEEFGEGRKAWLQERLSLPNGIPSHDTFGRVFAQLDPIAFESCFLAWTKALSERLPGQVVALDGKTIRRSFDAATGKGALHLVSAFASANRLVLGQAKVEDKENEIVALPALLDLLDLEGCIVTIDAMGCQKEIARQIIDKGADYALTVKGNHPDLLEDLSVCFEEAGTQGFLRDWPHTFTETCDYEHGRAEVRRCYAIGDVDWLKERHEDAWAGLRSIALVESHRTHKGKTSKERRYLISSLPAEAGVILSATRAHWGIENSLHWSLDVTFHEDLCRVRKDHAGQNFATLRKIAINTLQRDTTKKVGLKVKRYRAACDIHYLEQLITRY